MNFIGRLGFTERISGLAAGLREKLAGSSPSDNSDSAVIRNEDKVDIRRFRESSKPSGTAGVKDGVGAGDADKAFLRKSAPEAKAARVPVNLFMDAEESADAPVDQSTKENAPVFEYRSDQKTVTLFKVSACEEPEKSDSEFAKELNEFAEKRMNGFTYQDYKEEQKFGDELEDFTKPVIHNRYRDRKNMTVLEFGPVYTTAVPEALKGNGNEYVGLELGRPYIEKQREFLSLDPVLSSQSSEISGDMRKIPFKPASVDLMVASCCNPFFDKKESKVIDMFDEMARVLRPGGEAVIVPFSLEEGLSANVKESIFRNFELVETHRSITEYANCEDVRDLQVLRRRSG